MSRKVFQRKEYSIYRAGDGFIIHNTNKDFKIGHTHVSNFYKAKILVIMAIKREIDDKLSERDIESLIRLTNDNRYRNKLIDKL
ncbi:hypothetical protein [Clostridium sp. 1001270J_160509_D11]|uniref:hypothetical protein n=1 Tax=Clostridium sp. 1001270J_160509_D11 TaxID=2787103 RepID=UPI0018A97E1A|nr:hypothetical protein [Clostridium sp. 1001270J_160509_D11]